jgi:hypothetical protein
VFARDELLPKYTCRDRNDLFPRELFGRDFV